MFFNQDSTCVLKAKLAGSVATSQLKIDVTYRDNTDEYQPDVIVDTDNTTAVTLLAAPTGNVVNIVELIKIYNPDTQANTVQILANDEVIFTCTVGSNESVILSQESISNGLGYIPASVDLSNLTATGKEKAANLAMPSSSHIDLTLGASGTTYTAPADGYYCYYGHINNGYLHFGNLTASVYSMFQFNGDSGGASCFIPVQKGQIVAANYANIVSTTFFRFVYAEGSKP